MNNVWVLNFQLYGSLLTPFSLSFAMGVFSLFCCITDTRYGYGYTGTAIRELEKRHSGSIERVSEYQSIEVSDMQISDTGTAGLVKYR